MKRSTLMRRGFTLIELLVVIAIIAILAAILFPVFARAREKGKQAVCMSNVKQLMLAVIMYSSDWDGGTPKTTHPSGYEYWDKKVMPYVANDRLFTCPSSGYGTTYYAPAAFGGACAYCDTHSYRVRPKLEAVINPAEKVFLWESYCNAWCITDMNPLTNSPAYWPLHPRLRTNWGNGLCSDTMEERYSAHVGGANQGFVDGHAKWHSNGMMKEKMASWNDWPN